jgi:hypothetical protein
VPSTGADRTSSPARPLMTGRRTVARAVLAGALVRLSTGCTGSVAGHAPPLPAGRVFFQAWNSSFVMSCKSHSCGTLSAVTWTITSP